MVEETVFVITLGNVLTIVTIAGVIAAALWRFARRDAKRDAVTNTMQAEIKKQGEAILANQKIILQHIDECNERREEAAAVKEKVSSHEKRLDAISNRMYITRDEH